MSAGEVSLQELREHTADVLRRVESGERLLVTMDGRAVAQLGPLATWVPRQRALEALVQADPGLRRELHEALPDEA